MPLTGSVTVTVRVSAGVVAGMAGGEEALHLASADLFIGELNLLGRPFRESRLGMERIAQEAGLQAYLEKRIRYRISKAAEEAGA